MSLFLYETLRHIRHAKDNLRKEYSGERYIILLTHIESEIKKDLEKIEALENKQDILDLIPAKKDIK